MRINGEIEPILAEYIVAGIDAANTRHASLILITIDTPGGLDSSMREIIGAILHSSVPVVTYVFALWLARRIRRIFHSAFRRRCRHVAGHGHGRGFSAARIRGQSRES